MFSCKICEIFNNSFFYKTPPVAASGSDAKKDDKIEFFKTKDGSKNSFKIDMKLPMPDYLFCEVSRSY